MDPWLPVLIFLAAMLYASVGHAGASGYLAAMALFGLSPDAMKPSVLVLNLLVASIGTVQFARANRGVAVETLLPLALGSVPLAFLGGLAPPGGWWYRPLVGLGGVMALAAVVGGLIGARVGSTRFSTPTLRRVLALVLLIAAGKLLLTT